MICVCHSVPSLYAPSLSDVANTAVSRPSRTLAPPVTTLVPRHLPCSFPYIPLPSHLPQPPPPTPLPTFTFTLPLPQPYRPLSLRHAVPFSLPNRSTRPVHAEPHHLRPSLQQPQLPPMDLASPWHAFPALFAPLLFSRRPLNRLGRSFSFRFFPLAGRCPPPASTRSSYPAHVDHTPGRHQPTFIPRIPLPASRTRRFRAPVPAIAVVPAPTHGLPAPTHPVSHRCQLRARRDRA